MATFTFKLARVNATRPASRICFTLPTQWERGEPYSIRLAPGETHGIRHPWWQFWRGWYGSR